MCRCSKVSKLLLTGFEQISVVIKHLQDDAVFPAQEQEGGSGRLRLSGSIALEEQAQPRNLSHGQRIVHCKGGSLQGNRSAVSQRLFADVF